MARLTGDGEHLICDRCRLRLAMIGTVGARSTVPDSKTERVLFLIAGWRKVGDRIAESKSAITRRRAGHPPPLMPRRLAVSPRSKRGLGRRQPGYVAPAFPDFGHGAMVFHCTDCGTDHPVKASDIGVSPIPEISYFEPPPPER